MRRNNPVIFIHGAWVTPLCRRYFAPHFAAQGFQTLAPAWPYEERPVADQLANADPRLAKTGIPQIVEHYKKIIRRQPVSVLLTLTAPACNTGGGALASRADFAGGGRAPTMASTGSSSRHAASSAPL